MLGLALGLAGCTANNSGAGGTGGSSGSSSGAASSSTTQGTTTAGSATATDSASTTTAGATSTSSGGGTSAGATDTMTSGSFISGGSTSSGSAPNGAQCQIGTDCMSGFCRPFHQQGGVCSECVMDQDCTMGTCAIDFNLGYAVCTDGSLGMGCNTDAGCMGDLVCAPIFTGGNFSPEYCSECKTTADCSGGQICSPVHDMSTFQGYLACEDPGSVDNGGGCPVDDTGMGDGTVCASGFCGVVTLGMNNQINLGVCGECLADSDCPMGQTCMPPTSMMGQVTPAMCG